MARKPQFLVIVTLVSLRTLMCLGKTTTTERVLFYTGVSHKIGEVHDGAATMDWMEQRARTWYYHYFCCDNLFLVMETVPWTPYQRNWYPGRWLHNRSWTFYACSWWCVHGLLCCWWRSTSVPETVWRQTNKYYQVPRIVYAFVNKMDRWQLANFFRVIEQMKTRLKVVILCQFKIFQLVAEDTFAGVVDLIRWKRSIGMKHLKVWVRMAKSSWT